MSAFDTSTRHGELPRSNEAWVIHYTVNLEPGSMLGPVVTVPEWAEVRGQGMWARSCQWVPEGKTYTLQTLGRAEKPAQDSWHQNPPLPLLPCEQRAAVCTS